MKHAQIARTKFAPFLNAGIDEIVPAGAVYGKYKDMYYIHYDFSHYKDVKRSNQISHTMYINTWSGVFPVILYKRNGNRTYTREYPAKININTEMFDAIKKDFISAVTHYDADNMPLIRYTTSGIIIDWWHQMKWQNYDGINFEKMMLELGAPRRRKSRALAEEASRQANRKTLHHQKSSKKAPVLYDKGKHHLTDYSGTNKDRYMFHPGYENREPKEK